MHLLGDIILHRFLRMLVAFVLMLIHRCDWQTAKANSDEWTTPHTRRAKWITYGGGLIVLIAILVIEARVYFQQ